MLATKSPPTVDTATKVANYFTLIHFWKPTNGRLFRQIIIAFSVTIMFLIIDIITIFMFIAIIIITLLGGMMR